MTSSIPASTLVDVIPSVLGAGGNPLSLNALFVTEDPSIPIGTVQPFVSASAVSSWFGATSNQAALANVYFNGFTGCTRLPSVLYFVQFNAAAVAGYLRSGSLPALTTLNGLSAGTLTMTIDGTSTTSASINLSGASSYSAAAGLIQTAIQGGTPSSTATCTYDSLRNAFVITSGTTGANSEVLFPTTNTLATGLLLTSATGAVESPGAAASTPSATMNIATSVTQNWATFMTDFLPTQTVALEFASWVNTQNSRYLYVFYDNSTAPLSADASSSFGVLTSSYTGVTSIWNPSGYIAAFVCGTIASINFNATNGRITLAFKGQSGLSPDVTSATIAANLLSNYYNFYGQYATANQQFQFFQNGQMSGTWAWIDPYVNQIYWNAQFQLTLLTFLNQVKSVPYSPIGYGMIKSVLQPQIQQMLNFGAIVPGVTLSGSQAASVNSAAGVTIAPILQSTGWYLQVIDPDATVRGERGSPTCNLWYTDGGSVQQITLASIDIE